MTDVSQDDDGAAQQQSDIANLDLTANPHFRQMAKKLKRAQNRSQLTIACYQNCCNDLIQPLPLRQNRCQMQQLLLLLQQLPDKLTKKKSCHPVPHRNEPVLLHQINTNVISKYSWKERLKTIDILITDQQQEKLVQLTRLHFVRSSILVLKQAQLRTTRHRHGVSHVPC